MIGRNKSGVNLFYLYAGKAMNLVFSILITTPVLLQFSGVLVSIPSRLSINSHHSLDLGTVECGSWHGEPDPWAFQQHSLCTADIPGTRGSSYSSSLLPRLVPCLLSSPFFFPWTHQVEGTSSQRCLAGPPCRFIHKCTLLRPFSLILSSNLF